MKNILLETITKEIYDGMENLMILMSRVTPGLESLFHPYDCE